MKAGERGETGERGGKKRQTGRQDTSIIANHDKKKYENKAEFKARCSV